MREEGRISMDTRNKLFKAISIAAIAILGLSLSACGKKEEPAKEEYVYNATYESIQTNVDDMSVYANEVTEDKVYSILLKYTDTNYETYETYLREYDIASKKDTLTKLENSVKDTYVQYFHVYKDGSLKTFSSCFDEENMSQKYMLVSYSKEGKTLDVLGIEGLFENGNEFAYVGNVIFNEDGTMVVLTETAVALIDGNGNIIKKIESQEWLDGLTKGSGNTYYVTRYEDNAGRVIRALKEDFSGFGDKLEINVNNVELFEGSGDNIFVSTENSLKLFNTVTKETVEIWSWMDVDAEGDRCLGIKANSDGSYSVISEVWDNGFQGIEIATIKKEKAEPGKEKIKLVLGCYSLDSDIKVAVKDFNKNNQKYRISVKSYNEDGYVDYENLADKMGTDLTTGAIDIVILEDASSYMKYASSKALTSIDEYLNEIDKSNYFTNVFDALKVNGKAYAVTPNVSITTLAMAKDYSNGRSSLTMKDLLELRKQYRDKEFFEYSSNTSTLYTCMAYDMSTFVNYEKGECYFDSDAFIQVLEFANTFKNADEIEYNDYDGWEHMLSGDVIFAGLSLYDTNEISLYSQLLKGGIDIVGYPVSEGSGNIIVPMGYYAIAEKSKAKDGAWEFVKSLISEEYQNKVSYRMGFSVIKSVFEKDLKLRMTEDSFGSISNGFTTIEMKKLTKEEADLIRNIYESADHLVMYDEQIFSIVSEEVESFFAGQKSAGDVAGLIQGRVKIYLAESR